MDEVSPDLLVPMTKCESLLHGPSRNAGTTAATAGNFQPLAICFDINEKSRAPPPSLTAPNVEQNSPERRHETGTCSTKSARPEPTLNDSIYTI